MRVIDSSLVMLIVWIRTSMIALTTARR